MAEIRPFRGAHYNESVIEDFSSVICPPYDVITHQRQQELYLKSEYNFVRLESGRELPQDTAKDNKYTRSAATLERWLSEGILEVNTTPALYLHDHYFTYRGREYKRRSVITRVRIEEWDNMVIRPHEGTLTEARGDRLSLLWALQANTSPILAMYEDSGARISSLLSEQEKNKPLISTKRVDGEGHDVRVVTDTGVIDTISSTLVDRPLYIADGHHRYESALTYRHEKQAQSSSASGDEAYNYVMMSLVEFSDPGLVILAPHRLVRGILKPTLDELMTKLKVFFYIDELPLDSPDVWNRMEEMLKRPDKVRVGLFGTDTEGLLVLTLRDLAAANGMMPYFHSELYKALDVSIVDHIILENLLALSSDREKTGLAYSYDMADAVDRVLAQEYQLALLLSPVRPDMIKAISDAGDKMPRKSTYFYPKVPSGLVINRLE